MQAARKLGTCTLFAASNYCRRLVERSTLLNSRCCLVQMMSSSYTTAADVIPPPPSDIVSKQYSPKIEQLVTDISQLTLLEVADLNELLKKTLNIQDAPMMAMGAMPAVAAKEEDEEEAAPKREKMSFTVKLTKFDAGKKVALIKEIKSVVEGLNLVQAKKFVESVPQVVRADIPKEEAEKLKEALTAVGAEVEIE
ncbi:39S ribosomal protein L12, mitochondrial isoform X1 [Aplysia californica]|uniref:39S ribosomal protein L12, mitochondrial isoform X1 n=2 Tax=Aplysia californica TaxID=6500 RepID=A0ABM0JG87_APLCA|nr:39S ribosomal protein L12, mitochondrial isoform X1 [Aplysia californica]